LNSEVIYSGKDSYPKDTRKKKEDGKPKISGLLKKGRLKTIKIL
jgi:hypothetical protein